MKERKVSRVRSFLTNVLNVRLWADVERLKGFAQYILGAVKFVFISKQREEEDNHKSFNDVVKKMHLSEADLKRREVMLKRMSILLFLSGGLILLYGFYHFFYGTLQAAFLCYSISLISMALAFRYHFWYFQIKERKLKCSFSEWLRRGLARRKS